MPALCPSSDIEEGSSRGFDFGDSSVFVVRKDGELYVYANRCPHLGVELEWVQDQFLNSDSSLIQCSTHGALFLIEDGHCVAGPCLGENLRAIPFTIVDDHIFLDDI